jgi:glycosyltransferase involved in cell wall biosynthesis
MKVCIVTCYKQPDYIRALTLRESLSEIEGVDLVVVKNTQTGVLRYFEVMYKVLTTRFKEKPDMFILTFRGYELLMPMRLLTAGKTYVFDEFINLYEWVVFEHKKLKDGSAGARLLKNWYRFWLKRTDAILTDTVSHADLSAEIMRLPRERFYPLIVSTDEHTFKPDASSNGTVYADPKAFQVFYYGNMLPLHGVDVVIDAAKRLKKRSDIHFTIVGGKEALAEKVRQAVGEGAHIDYKKWVEFDQLPRYMAAADVCLGGPFGGTFQSQYVITGKTYQLLQMGCAVVIGKSKESHIFTDKKNALIVEQGNAKALADAFVWAYENQDKLPAIAKSGHELYVKELSNKALTTQVRHLLVDFGLKNR